MIIREMQWNNVHCSITYYVMAKIILSFNCVNLDHPGKLNIKIYNYTKCFDTKI